MDERVDDELTTTDDELAWCVVKSAQVRRCEVSAPYRLPSGPETSFFRASGSVMPHAPSDLRDAPGAR